jgi:galactokinase
VGHTKPDSGRVTPVTKQQEVVCAAPGRVNLIGEHLDYNGGRCLPVALPYTCRAACVPRSDGIITLRSRQTEEEWTGSLDDARTARGWAGYAAGVLWALSRSGIDVTGADLTLDSDVPVGSGLSSSAAVECSVGLALTLALGMSDDDRLRGQLVDACVRAENEVVGAPTGGMDQTVALFARPEHALLIDFANGARRQVPWDPAGRGCTLLVVDTRVQHSLDDGSYGDRRAESERAAAELGISALASADPEATEVLDRVLALRARHVVTEQARVDAVVAALDEDDWDAVGPLLTDSHVSLRDDFEVSCPELDTVVDVALEHGAIGARMTGGGFGGSAIALVPEGRRTAVAGAVLDAFAAHGWTEPRILDGTASRAAHRLD